MIRNAFILILSLVMHLNGNMSYAQGRVGIYGVVSVVSGDLEDLSFVVYGDGMEARRVWLTKKGKFYFDIPIDRVAYIRCAKPGYLTKRIKIDTRNAFVTKYNARFNKEVDFDLEMIPQAYNSERYFQGPVATLTFNERSGLLKITYDYRLRKPTTPDPLLVESKR